jgi:metallo-beta-lactamase family protein
MDSFSAHADRGEIVQFLSNQKKRVRKIFLVHGEIKRQAPFRQMLLDDGFPSVEIPALGEEFKL